MKKTAAILLALLLTASLACAETYTATEQGFGGEVKVTLTVEDGKIVAAEAIGDQESSPVMGTDLSPLAAQIVEAQGAEIDGVAGATITGNAVKAAAAAIMNEVNGVAEEAKEFADGEYKTTVPGFYGPFEMTIVIENGAIASVACGENAETPTLGGKAIAIMTADMAARNTAMVDVVAGATLTSAALRNAALSCLKEAGAPEALLTAPAPAERTAEEISTQILVIGSGAAGYAAAITAAEAGAEVTMIEKQGLIGGSTITSAGIVYAALDEADVPKMVQYYMGRAEGNADEEQLTYFAENSMATKEWLTAHGVEWMFSAPAGTAPEPRANFSMFVTGASLINPLAAKAEELGIRLMLNTRATELITDESGAVVGAKAEGKDTDYTFRAGAVVLATGGFDASEEMKAKFTPVAVGDFPLSSKGNVGDGLNMAMAIGAATEFKNGSIGFILVDGSQPNSGLSGVGMATQVFVAEDGSFLDTFVDYPLYYAMMKRNNLTWCWGIFDATNAETVAPALAAGFGCEGETLEALAAAAGMDAAKLAEAVKGTTIGEGPYYAVTIKPSTIGSMGGLKTNTRGEILSESGAPIAGLFGAGEVANPGFYYHEYPASGSSISLAFTFGRAAGASAAAYAAGK